MWTVADKSSLPQLQTTLSLNLRIPDDRFSSTSNCLSRLPKYNTYQVGGFFAKRYHGENGEIIKLILQPKQWLLDSFLYIVSKAVSFVNLLIGHLYYVCEARVPNKYTLLLQI